jgi:hypothetical protein
MVKNYKKEEKQNIMFNKSHKELNKINLEEAKHLNYQEIMLLVIKNLTKNQKI